MNKPNPLTAVQSTYLKALTERDAAALDAEACTEKRILAADRHRAAEAALAAAIQAVLDAVVGPTK